MCPSLTARHFFKRSPRCQVPRACPSCRHHISSIPLPAPAINFKGMHLLNAADMSAICHQSSLLNSRSEQLALDSTKVQLENEKNTRRNSATLIELLSVLRELTHKVIGNAFYHAAHVQTSYHQNPSLRQTIRHFHQTGFTRRPLLNLGPQHLSKPGSSSTLAAPRPSPTQSLNLLPHREGKQEKIAWIHRQRRDDPMKFGEGQRRGTAVTKQCA